MERWFERRHKNKVLDIAYRQMTLALDIVNDLERAVKAVFQVIRLVQKLLLSAFSSLRRR